MYTQYFSVIHINILHMLFHKTVQGQICILTLRNMTLQVYGSAHKILFCLRFYVPVNSYGHVEMVSLPNHTFFLGKLD